jgi:hypothetical protein
LLNNNKQKFQVFVKNEPRCRICNCEYVDQVSALILQKKTGLEIKSWLFAHGFKTSDTACKRHKRLHCYIARADYKPPIDFRPDDITPSDLTPEQYQGVSKFLDDVIKKANDNLHSGKIQANLSDALKAAEIKTRTGSDDQKKQDVINFFLEIASVDLDTNKTKHEG